MVLLGESLTMIPYLERTTIYLLLTRFEVRIVSYEPSFFLFACGPSTEHVGHKSMGTKQGS